MGKILMILFAAMFVSTLLASYIDALSTYHVTFLGETY